MKATVLKTTTDKEQVKKLIIKKVVQAEKLVLEIKELIKKTDLLQENRR
jgi:hypothetical protein